MTDLTSVDLLYQIDLNKHAIADGNLCFIVINLIDLRD